MLVVLGLQHRVDGHGHDSGLDATEKDRRKIDRVGHAEQHPLLRLEAESPQRHRATVYAFGECAVRVFTLIVDIGELACTPGLEIALDEVVRGVVTPWNFHPWWARAAGD